MYAKSQILEWFLKWQLGLFRHCIYPNSWCISSPVSQAILPSDLFEKVDYNSYYVSVNIILFELFRNSEFEKKNTDLL